MTRSTAHSRRCGDLRGCAPAPGAPAPRSSEGSVHSLRSVEKAHRSSSAHSKTLEPDIDVRFYAGSMTDALLFQPLSLGPLTLPNRVVMAPMTRYRATDDGTPTEAVATYYAQRASAGLIISEGIWPSSRGQSDWRVPGLETRAHIDGWRLVTEAVHDAGGRIFAQLMHGGRKGHPRARVRRLGPRRPVGRRRTGDGSPPRGWQDRGRGTPRHDACSTSGAPSASSLKRRGTQCSAGFDGVELHGANSYLIHQFLADNTNVRTDLYGGTTDNRIRFATRGRGRGGRARSVQIERRCACPRQSPVRHGRVGSRSGLPSTGRAARRRSGSPTCTSPTVTPIPRWRTCGRAGPEP